MQFSDIDSIEGTVVLEHVKGQMAAFKHISLSNLHHLPPLETHSHEEWSKSPESELRTRSTP